MVLDRLEVGDHLVRQVGERGRDLDRRRTERLAILKQEKDLVLERVEGLSKMESSIGVLVQLGALALMAAVAFAVYAGAGSRLPGKVGLGVLWFIACPAAALLTLGIARRSGATALFATMALVTSFGLWLYESSRDPIPVVQVGQR